MRKTGWVAALTIAIAVLAAACSAGGDVPHIEQRAQDLNRGIMCPVCPGESIDQSQHPLTVQMRGIVFERLEQGWTEEEIRSSFVDSYGPMVLLEPPRSGFNYLVWVVPPLGLILAGALLYWVLRTLRRPRIEEREGVLAGLQLSDAERAGYVRRIEASLLASEERSGAAESARHLSDSEAEGVT